MSPVEVIAVLRHLDGWPVQKHSCKKVQEAIGAAIKMIDRMEKMEAALQIAMQQNSHDMLMTGDELRQCEAAMEKSK